ncbi:hypothetical protein LTR53_008508 [Teratosphaeriaceae sp. CCFEE 6253]|nr:hypothetical protein LTR53_008508 [Teratosphaeriaceae sp. CCFEE 6253]
MASCVNACSTNANCEGTGYDSLTGQCYEYCAEVPDSGMPSPNVQFAQRKVRAVVNNGVTLSSSISTVYTTNGVNVQGGTTYTYLTRASSASIASTGVSSTYNTPTGILTVTRLSSATAPTSAGPTETSVAYSCPANDGQVITENGLAYVLSCGGALSTGIPYTAAIASTSINDCFRQCDQSSIDRGALYCTGFTYVGVENGAGAGSCYLYDDVAEGFVAGNSTTIAAIRLVNYVGDAMPTLPVSISASAGAGAGTSASTSTSLASIASPIGSVTTNTISPTSVGAGTGTCTNGGNILNGCIVASITPDPNAGASPGVGVIGPSSSTILTVGVSVTASASLSVGASLGVGVSTGSSGISIRIDPSLGLGLSGTLGAGASATGGAVPSTSSSVNMLTTVLPVTTVLSTTIITSCSSVLGGQLTCPSGASNTLLASVSTAVPTGSGMTVYIAFTTTVTTGSMTTSSPASSSSSCTTLLGGVVTCGALNLNLLSTTTSSSSAPSHDKRPINCIHD